MNPSLKRTALVRTRKIVVAAAAAAIVVVVGAVVVVVVIRVCFRRNTGYGKGALFV